MGFFRNYLPFRWRKISEFFDSLKLTGVRHKPGPGQSVQKGRNHPPGGPLRAAGPTDGLPEATPFLCGRAHGPCPTGVLSINIP
jgi:hypothetical protein